MIKDIAVACRSYRRFYQDERIDASTVADWVDAARVTASSANAQPLRYVVVTSPEDCAQMFQWVAWAGALPEWDGPEEGERPAAYVVILRDVNVSIGEKFTSWDEGIAAQTLMLAATEAGYGGCMIASFRKKSVTGFCNQLAGLDEGVLEADLVLALGKPKEEVHIVGKREDGSLKYYRDEELVHYVPKRSLDEILVCAR